MPDSYWQPFVDAENMGRAGLPPTATPAHKALRRPLRSELGVPDGWDPSLELHLMKPPPDGLPPTDFLDCSNMPFVVTEEVREVIEPLLHPTDEVIWLPIALRLPDGDLEQRYFIRPLGGPDLVDTAASKQGPSIPPGITAITVARFSRERVGQRQLFAYAYGPNPVMSPAIREAIEQAGLTGIEEWSPVRLV